MFFRIDDRLFRLARELSANVFYSSELPPDTFELISKTNESIEFTVTTHYYSTYYAMTENIPTSASYPIKMVMTDNGWRFSLFNTVICDFIG